MPSDYSSLRELLVQWEPAAGPSGFEGLVAQALALVTNFTFRLARSGSQFGRDGATAGPSFAIAMEAKRYDQSVPLQELVGKAGLAGFALAGRIDVWVLAATVEVNETTWRPLAAILDDYGISALILDWAQSGLPRLAVLFAAAGEDLLAWIETTKGTAARTDMAVALRDVRNDDRYTASLAEIETELTAATFGFDALRRSSEQWARTRFGDRRQSQLAFSQFVVPLSPDHPTTPRENLRAAIGHGMAALPAGSILAVLGPEGSGKTWAIAQWWLAQDPAPIFLVAMGTISDRFRPDDEPLDMLARLVAFQSGRSDDEMVQRWRRRLENWSGATAPSLRFCVVLDGLNERSGRPWATILRTLAIAVAGLGGVLVATCREGYWNREIAQRMDENLIRQVSVGDYDDDEFAEMLLLHGHHRRDLRPELDRFMRNPRVFNLALLILPALQSIDMLSQDRLLAEYWRARLLERGDLVGHNIEDFNNLLKSHARSYLGRPGIRFHRDRWREHSGAVARDDGRSLRDDLTDIEEGLFFKTDRGQYVFRREAARFALGLLMADEVREAIGEQASPAEVFDRMQRVLDQVQGFDLVADVVAAAICVGCRDAEFPDSGITALVRCFSSLQNVGDDQWHGLLGYFVERPDAFLDAYEALDDGNGNGKVLLDLVLEARRHPALEGPLGNRINRWLGTWTRDTFRLGTDRHPQRNAEIDRNLAALTPLERAAFDRLCTESGSRAHLARAAALLVADGPQAGFARGIVAHGLAITLAEDIDTANPDLIWAIRLNRIDHPLLAERVRSLLGPFLADDASELGHRCAARCLRFLGTSGDAELAQQLDPLERPRQWRRVEQLCAVDPLDPTTSEPENISNAVALADSLDHQQCWIHMGPTTQDHDLDMVIPGLARFRSQPLVALARRIVGDGAGREGLRLRQLGWRLPWIGPLFDRGSTDVVHDTVVRLTAEPSLLDPHDVNFVTAHIVESLLPRLSSEEQFELLAGLPAESPFYRRYGRHARPSQPLDTERWLQRLQQANAAGSLTRVLYQVASSNPELTPDGRNLVRTFFRSSDDRVVAGAFELCIGAADAELDDLVLALLPLPRRGADARGRTVRLAFTVALRRRHRADLLRFAPGEHLDWLAARLPEAVPFLADAVEATVTRLLQPIVAQPPANVGISLNLEPDELEERLSVDDETPLPENAIDALNRMFGNDAGRQFDERRQTIREQFDAYMESLDLEGAITAASSPFVGGLGEVVRAFPDRVRGWLERILSVSDERTLTQIHNFSIPLANAFSTNDADLAERVFRHLWETKPLVEVTLGPAGLRLRDFMLFSAVRSQGITDLWRQVFSKATSDGEIERLVLAASQRGAGDWLNQFVLECLGSDFPASVALGYTIASFRPTNAQSDAVFQAIPHDQSFLTDVMYASANHYRRDGWTRHWVELACRANEAIEFWRYAELAVRAADGRAIGWLPDRIHELEARFGGEVTHRIEERIKSARGDAAKRLFHLERPSGQMSELLFKGPR